MILTGLFLVKTVTLMPAILISDWFYYKNTGKFLDQGFDILAVSITLITGIFLFIYFKNKSSVEIDT